MTHDFIALPSQRHAAPGVQPVVATVESAWFLQARIVPWRALRRAQWDRFPRERCAELA